MTRVWNKDQDYEMLKSWWAGHGWEAIPKEDLPDTGFIANECAFGCLYIDIHGRFAMLEWIVTDPKASPRECLKGLNEVLDRLVAMAKEIGVKRMYSVLKNVNLEKLYIKHGFIKGDTQVCDMFWVGE